ncbi:hypothetical protein BCR32DRAFT_276171 [Anaeromyces robustus]|uniref:Uncharacterized protein n=1 Tax=Anaeromyces robustus TaxID=1754192 RepID=A0A1Y1XJL2_9FUNG|nr:hypothetical protein BCR32DRAFT_276171 [Anaeromyces robustus]|eukprot:ORX85616.1 hypothetical protein BCR32DRAFT_276171 [Anaeromyces robustus]
MNFKLSVWIAFVFITCFMSVNGKNWCGVRHCNSFCGKNLGKELTKDMNNGKIPYSDGDILVYDVNNNDKWLPSNLELKLN